MYKYKGIQTPKETNRERDTNRFTFSLASDTDFEKSCFFHGELKFLINNFYSVLRNLLTFTYFLSVL